MKYSGDAGGSHVRKEGKTMETVVAVVLPRHWLVSCPFCGQAHSHAPGEGVRLAHCWQGEYKVTGPA